MARIDAAGGGAEETSKDVIGMIVLSSAIFAIARGNDCYE